jgi:ADP-ribosyl-[dinitrogen reductase] hydrolase
MSRPSSAIRVRTVAGIDADKSLGAMLGHAVGERLGGGGTGTQMGFRLADSLIARGGFDPDDVLSAYVSWHGTKPEGLDPATDEVLRRVSAGADSYAATSVVASTGGGTTALTRTLPIAIAFAHHPEGMRDATVADAALTDYDPLAGKAALLLNQSVGLLVTRGPRAFSASLEDPLQIDDRLQDVVLPAIGGVRRIAEDAATSDPRSVVTPIAVSFAAYFTSDSFERGLEWAGNAGGDAAANGAVTGALLGARFGASHVPVAWIEGLDGRAQVERLHAGLVQLAG